MKLLFIGFLLISSLSCATRSGKKYGDISIEKFDGLRIFLYRKPGMWGSASTTSVNPDLWIKS